MEHIGFHGMEEGLDEGVIGHLAGAVRHARLDAMRAHEARYTMLADALAALTQRLVHARASVGTAALGVNGSDLHRKGFVLALTLATLARAPGIKARSRHSVDTAHERQVVLVPVYFDEGEDLRFRSEANRMAFFKSSCSSLSTL